MINVGKKIFLVSIILALITSGIGFYYINSLSNVKPVVKEKITIVVATNKIDAMTKITEDMVKNIEVTKENFYGEYISKKADVIGKYTNVEIFKNEKLINEKLTSDINNTLSYKVKGSNRAISLFMNGNSGVSDLLKPGDRVDLVLFLPELRESERIVRPNMSKLLMQNIEILSIDKNFLNSDSSREEIPKNFLVTLSIPSFDLEKLVLAKNIGVINLALRPLKGDFIYDTDGAVWQELILDDLYKMKDLFPQYKIKSIKGNEIEGENKYDKYIYYTIKYGDTLRSIAKDFYGDESKYILIKQVNRIDDEDKINSGTGIKIPVISN
ncbi:Flp pilus assembly protein CpaB [Helicovermis profundi]|uniref:LysM domain-containing protein n=1 Tax=Helicovermis profundi TaxID=3065157 RepID=A0AAU9DZR7_9FIRM|nr:hypothetical protein HLPR_00520 [Clostridia bacterium S502]